MRTTKLLNHIRQAQSLYTDTAERQNVFKLLLDALVEITDSEYGFFDEVLHDPDGTVYKKSLALSDISWDELSKHLYQELTAQNLEFRKLNNLSRLPALTGEVLISNDIEAGP